MDPTSIAVDIQHRDAGKGRGAYKATQWCRQLTGGPIGVVHCIGDSPSDLEMATWCQNHGLPTNFVYVGRASDLATTPCQKFPVTVTKDAGVLGTIAAISATPVGVPTRQHDLGGSGIAA